MKDYRFAIVGCGKISGRHAAQIASVGRLAAVCDIIPLKAAELAAQYGAVPYTSIQDLLDHESGLDVVSICTPNYLHAGHSIASLEAGFHVLCEKPLAISLHDAQRMQAAATACNKRLFVVKSTRFNPPVQAIKTLMSRERWVGYTVFN